MLAVAWKLSTRLWIATSSTSTSSEHANYFCTVTWEFCIYKINGCKLLTLLERVFKETIKVVHHQKLVNQRSFNGALVIGKINNSFFESIKKKKKNWWYRMIKKKGSRNIKHIWAEERFVQQSKVAYIYVRFLQVVTWCKICCKNVQSKQNFGMWMYFQISLSWWELQEIRDMLSSLTQEIGKKSLSRFFSVGYLHVIYKAWKRYSYWGVSITLSNTFTRPYCKWGNLRLTNFQSNLPWTILPWKRN